MWHPQEQPWRLQCQDQVCCVAGSDGGILARAGNSFICLHTGHGAFFLEGLWCHEQFLFVEIGGILQLSNSGPLLQTHGRVLYVRVR